MGMAKNWESFVSMTRAKAESHRKVAQYWDRVHNILSMMLIFLSAMTTLSTLLPISHYFGAALGTVTTLVSAINGSLNPSGRRQNQMAASRRFMALMLIMIRVETERDYEEIWKEYNKELLDEPFLPSRSRVEDDAAFSMSPELHKLIAEKEADVHVECTSNLGVEEDRFVHVIENDVSESVENGENYRETDTELVITSLNEF